MSDTQVKIETGVVVMLKSGGPLMTVGEDAGHGAHCALWFDQDRLERGVFPDASLQVVPDSDQRLAHNR